MKIIDISTKTFPNTFTMVDDEDFARLMTFNKWSLGGLKKKRYVKTAKTVNHKKSAFYMHRVILNLKPGEMGDHKDGNTLDNRKENLRKCTQAQNNLNTRPLNGKTSKYKGVCWRKIEKKWYARIKAGIKIVSIGYFKDEVEAAKAYDAAAIIHHGEFAWLNFPLNRRNP